MGRFGRTVRLPACVPAWLPGVVVGVLIAAAAVLARPGTAWAGRRVAVAALSRAVSAPVQTVAYDDRRKRSAGFDADGDSIGIGQGVGKCLACHDMAEGRSHPVGMAVDRLLPAGLPLESGKMTCLTCHEGDSLSHYDRTLRDGRMLRRELVGARNACAVCHDDQFGMTGAKKDHRAAAHAGVMGRAHLDSRSPAGSLASRSQHWRTNECMACHDGVMSVEGDAALGGTGMGLTGLVFSSGPGIGASHPVDVHYPQNGRGVSGAGEAFRMVDRKRVDGRIDLTGGKVSCASCHSLYSQEKSLLVMSNRGSALCLSCHDQ